MLFAVSYCCSCYRDTYAGGVLAYWYRVGPDQGSYSASGPFSTGMDDQLLADSHLSMQTASQANSAWLSIHA